MTSKNKILYLEILRILACFLVLFNHTQQFIIPNSSSAHILKYFMFMICKIAVPLFFMISGYLALKKEYSYKELYLKKLLRILIPLLICSVIAYCKYYKNLSLIGFFQTIYSKPVLNLYWYLYVILTLYLITPFLNKMVKNFKNMDFIIFIIIMLIIPGIFPFIRIYGHLNISNHLISPLFNTAVAYYVTGYFLGKIDITKKDAIIASICGTLTWVISVILLFINFKTTGNNSLFLDSTSYITTVIPSLSTFVVFKYVIGHLKINEKVCKIITLISSTTFGIYLMHMLFINELYSTKFFQSLFNINGFLGSIILDIALFIICSLITLIIKKIPKVGKYI